MIRWGILGAGNIAERFANSLRHEQNSLLEAVSCRSLEKAERFRKAHGAGKAYAGYEQMLLDPALDAVYLALPHGLHREWAVKALEAGKAVLCEKPCALNAEEVLEIRRAAEESGCLFMEAMKPRFTPLYMHLKERIEECMIGRLIRIEASLCNAMPFSPDHPTYHTQPVQGGALLDVGTYCAGYLQDFLGKDPRIGDVSVTMQGSVDYYVLAEMVFPGGESALLECAFDRAKPRTCRMIGDKGELPIRELHRPWEAVLYRSGKAEEITVPYEVDDFYGEIFHFVRCLEEGRKESPVMPLSASEETAQILDRIREAFPE